MFSSRSYLTALPDPQPNPEPDLVRGVAIPTIQKTYTLAAWALLYRLTSYNLPNNELPKSRAVKKLEKIRQNHNYDLLRARLNFVSIAEYLTRLEPQRHPLTRAPCPPSLDDINLLSLRTDAMLLTQAQLAAILGVSTQTYARLEAMPTSPATSPAIAGSVTKTHTPLLRVKAAAQALLYELSIPPTEMAYKRQDVPYNQLKVRSQP